MKKIILSTTILSFLFLNLTFAKGFGKDDVVQFCRDKPSPIVGKQFNGVYANRKILELVAGKHTYPNGGALLLFTSNYYIVKLPTNRNLLLKDNGFEYGSMYEKKREGDILRVSVRDGFLGIRWVFDVE